MNVEIRPLIRDTVAQLGAGVPYALKVVAGQLAEEPDLGRPSSLPGILTVMIDGDVFEDCPALVIGYIREPDRIEIRYVSVVDLSDPTAPRQEEGQGQEHRPAPLVPSDPADEALTVREIADAWHRITRWLQHHAPDSCAALRTGADPAEIAALEGEFGVRIPVGLRVLWLLTAGDDGVDGGGCLPGNRALLTLDAVAATYRMRMNLQAGEDSRNAERPEGERITLWKPSWIPVVALGPDDHTSGLYLDIETGCLGKWSRYYEAPDDELDTLVTYLEEVADMLEAPDLATRDKPGLIGGTLVWLSGIEPARDDRWQPLTG
ncbi:hypothetical protein AB0L85_26245 [Streptomyces sp. NPDC052051]|uniref:hypothetical protein n=1 Tax=Streptomyces sp. NPDC052051 TaxID=3154649 RepID=UPI0034267012